MKSETKRRYKRKCYRRHIDFYIKDKELYEFSKTINFNQTIKDYLKSLMEQTEETPITEEVFLGEAASATISGPMFTIYKLN